MIFFIKYIFDEMIWILIINWYLYIVFILNFFLTQINIIHFSIIIKNHTNFVFQHILSSWSFYQFTFSTNFFYVETRDILYHSIFIVSWYINIMSRLVTIQFFFLFSQSKKLFFQMIKNWFRRHSTRFSIMLW